MSSPRNVRPLRPHLPDVRPLDRFKTLKIKMAIVVVATVPILLVYPFLQKYFTKGVLTGSIKG